MSADPGERQYLDLLRARGELREITAPVDPRFEIAEIGRASCRERVYTSV